MLALVLLAGLMVDTVPTGPAFTVHERPFQTWARPSETGHGEIPQVAPDRWLGEDKFKHFWMSFAITAFGYAGARTVFDREPSIRMAVAASAAAGVLKEVHDQRAQQPFSMRDLVWDAAGIALAYVVVRQTN